MAMVETEEVIGAISPVVFLKPGLEGWDLKICKLAFTSQRIMYAFFNYENNAHFDLSDIKGEKRWAKVKEDIRIGHQVTFGPESLVDMPQITNGLLNVLTPYVSYEAIESVIVDMRGVTNEYTVTFKTHLLGTRSFRAEKSSFRELEELLGRTPLRQKLTIIR